MTEKKERVRGDGVCYWGAAGGCDCKDLCDAVVAARPGWTWRRSCGSHAPAYERADGVQVHMNREPWKGASKAMIFHPALGWFHDVPWRQLCYSAEEWLRIVDEVMPVKEKPASPGPA